MKWLFKLEFWFIHYSSATRTYPFRLWKETGQGVAVIPKVDDEGGAGIKGPDYLAGDIVVRPKG